jgi:CheY-like chemotaxis protein
MRRLLVVEDHEMSRTMLRRRLCRLGFEVLSATNGREAVIKAKGHLPDLIVMDLTLPVMDGFAATRLLKGNLETKGIPILALTAQAMAGDRERALGAGCDEYEIKPVNFERLLEKIDGLITPERQS